MCRFNTANESTTVLGRELQTAGAQQRKTVHCSNSSDTDDERRVLVWTMAACRLR